MPNESAKQARILTEEDLQHFEIINANSTLSYAAGSALIASHRELLWANAELSFKNNEFKKRIQGSLNYNQPVGYEDYETWTSILRSLLTKTLEELK